MALVKTAAQHGLFTAWDIIGSHIEFDMWIGDDTMTAIDFEAYWWDLLGQTRDSGWWVNGTKNSNFIGGSNLDDVLIGKAGNDSLEGNDGDDLLAGDSASHENLNPWGGETLPGGHDSLDGGAGDDALFGGGGNDTLRGGEGWDELVGNDGNDLLIGGAGWDEMAGGKGNDTYHITSWDDVYENASEGTDTVIVLDQESYTLKANFENLVYSYTGNANLTGNGLDNLIQGGSGADTIKSGAGNDTLDGGMGNDSMVGGAGNDTYVVFNTGDKVVEAADGGYDTVRTTLTDYTLGATIENLETIGAYGITGIGNALGNTMLGNAVADTFYGRDGNDAIMGRGGNDSLWGENGADWMTGDGGVDWLRGGAGNDTILGGDDMDYLYGGDDNDALDGGNGGDIVFGDAGNDSAQGNAGNDTVYGGAGTDTLRGGEGNDRLRGDAGADVLYGDAGQDRFLYGSTADSNAAGGRDTIHGFERGVDKIDLSLIDANTNNATGNDAFWVPGPGTVFYSEGALTFTGTLGGTRVDGDVNFDGTADLSLMVWGVWGLTASDFIL